MAQDEDEFPQAIDRVVDLATDYAPKIDVVLVKISKEAAPDKYSETDVLSGVIVSLLLHANCYVRVLKDRVPASHMEALSNIATALANQIYADYESEYVTGRINSKGPEEPS